MKVTYQATPAPKPAAVLPGAGGVLGKSAISDFLTIRIDTREQDPLRFDSEYVRAGAGTVPVFDYALEGDQDNFAVERKSLDDFISSVTLAANWKRELAKIERARAWGKPIVYILEADFRGIGEYDYSRHHSGAITPQFVYRRIAELVFEHGAVVWFAGGRREAAYSVCLILKRRLEQIRRQLK